MSRKKQRDRYVLERLSPSAKTAWKKRFGWLSRGELQEVISLAKQALPQTDPEANIAREHCDPAMVCKVYRHEELKRGASRLLQTIYCCSSRCDKCPHGPYFYILRKRKKDGLIRVRYEGKPAFHPDLIERMMADVRPPIAVYEISN
jgi:hypothetical protein